MTTRHSHDSFMERCARSVTEWSGSSWAFGAAVAAIALWLLTGPLFRFSDTWQLVVNTGTTIITFLMVFLIQRSQNKDSAAIHLKLNELVAVIEGASNRLVDVESLSEEEIAILREHFHALASMARRDGDLGRSHSIEEATRRAKRKSARSTAPESRANGAASRA